MGLGTSPVANICFGGNIEFYTTNKNRIKFGPMPGCAQNAKHW